MLCRCCTLTCTCIHVYTELLLHFRYLNLVLFGWPKHNKYFLMWALNTFSVLLCLLHFWPRIPFNPSPALSVIFLDVWTGLSHFPGHSGLWPKMLTYILGSLKSKQPKNLSIRHAYFLLSIPLFLDSRFLIINNTVSCLHNFFWQKLF